MYRNSDERSITYVPLSTKLSAYCLATFDPAEKIATSARLLSKVASSSI